jgi:hypothetical protein
MCMYSWYHCMTGYTYQKIAIVQCITLLLCYVMRNTIAYRKGVRSDGKNLTDIPACQ